MIADNQVHEVLSGLDIGIVPADKKKAKLSELRKSAGLKR